MRNYTLLLILLCAMTKLSAQTLSERLYATTYYYNNAGTFIPSDSNHFYYINDSIGGGTEQINARPFAHWDTMYYRHYQNGVWNNINQSIVIPDGQSENSLFNQQNWNGNNYFEKYREMYVQDSSHNLLQMTVGNYDTTHATWDTSYIDTYTYDSSNRLLTHGHRQWPLGNTGGDYEDVYTYDASGNKLSKTGHYYYNGWVPTSLQTYTYDANNKNLSYEYQSWDTASLSWINGTQTLHNYNSALDDTLDIVQNWVASQWQNYSYTTHSYDGHHDVLIGLIQNWNTATSTWYNNYTYTNTFDANYNIISQIVQNWDTVASAYFNANRHTYSYNTSNLLTSNLYEKYDTASASWVNSTRNDRTYTALNNISQDQYYKWSGGAWANNYTNTYFWEPYAIPAVTTGIIERTPQMVSVYPNPMNGSAVVSFDGNTNEPGILMLWNMQGQIADTKIVEVQNGRNEIIYTDQSLPSGLYQGQIKTSKGSFSFRMVKN